MPTTDRTAGRDPEEVTGDLVAWALLLLGVVFGLGTLGAVEVLARLGR
jgi:hypothetical protein